ncbi:hypothetical protein [Rufibacter quisquiliarum]|uniref:Uncharacterized protein n=1 Tax=Rufibacter quisquiliarum TaxID=1549639 RepID=A0A839GWV9_9BACT|nr:hypothetical protein [Rufibacter quisquiliarum]MBA9078908.1 hypothetical protein [Rufibacter quisquiliarum]
MALLLPTNRKRSGAFLNRGAPQVHAFCFRPVFWKTGRKQKWRHFKIGMLPPFPGSTKTAITITVEYIITELFRVLETAYRWDVIFSRSCFLFSGCFPENSPKTESSFYMPRGPAPRI